MRKSAVIATCLLNSGMVRRLEDGEIAVKRVFEHERPTGDLSTWDSEIQEASSEAPPGLPQRFVSTVRFGHGGGLINQRPCQISGITLMEIPNVATLRGWLHHRHGALCLGVVP